MFLIQQANIRSSELKTAKEFNKEVKNIDEAANKKISNIEVSAYASPDGGVSLNTTLAENRQDNTAKIINRDLKKAKINAAVDTKYTAQDWEGFQELVSKSNIQDKELILRVLSMYQDPEQREQEIKNISSVYKTLADEILPQLRRSRLTLNYEIIGKSDEEIANLADSDAKQLNIEELLYATTLTKDAAKQEAIFTKATQIYPNDFRAYNNLGKLAYQAGDLDKAESYFKKALSIKDAPEANMNLGLIALTKGDRTAAESYLSKASGSKELNEALGNLYVAQGQYDKAVSSFGDTKTNSAAQLPHYYEQLPAQTFITTERSHENGKSFNRQYILLFATNSTPRQLSLSEQGDYYLLSYKATLWKTGLPGDSLLRNALTCYKQSNLQAKWLQAHIEQSASYLYKNLPDSTLLSTGKLLKEYQLNDTLKTRIYGLRRAAYYRKQDYNQALAMADSSKQLTRKSKDTLAYFTASQLYLQIIEAMQQHEKYTQGYKKLIEELRDSPNHQSLIYYAFENLLNTSLERKDYRQALKYLQLLSNERRSRYEIPHYLLLRGRTYAALNQTDSAKYYYQQAATSTSEFIAMEANALLFNLINQEDYPEQAFYSKQKENTIKNNILGNINSEIQRREFNELKLQNELYQLHFQQQKHELWMLGIITALLSVGFIAFFFYQREKKERLQQENLLLHKEAELSGLREKEIRQRNKEAELREALFRRISFFHKLPSLHTDDKQDESAANSKIVVTNTEWAEVISVVNDAFDNFVVRLQQAYPSLGEKEIGFCCLVKINVNIQDLSDIYCISKAAITKRKYRIKTDKLGITDENISLDSFLKAF